jgi:DNA-directed RNA polymerase subunit RPC12/RpoP
MKNPEKIFCPYCNSEEISKPRLSGRAFAISFLLLGFPIPFLEKSYHCFDCGQDFKLKNSYKNKE